MEPAADTDYVRTFVEELLRAGLMLSGLLADLIESLPRDAYPGEDVGEVVVEMLVGTVTPVVSARGRRPVMDAVALIADASEKTLTDLKLALELRKRMRSGSSANSHRRFG